MSLRVVVSRVVAGWIANDAAMTPDAWSGSSQERITRLCIRHWAHTSFSGLDAAEPAQAKRRHRDEGTGQGQS